MTASKGIMLVVFAALFCVLCSPNARADDWNEKTTVKIYEPIEIPGHVLSAGTYVFELANSQSDRTILQIWSGDETHVLYTINGIPAYREEPTGKTVLRLAKQSNGGPERLTKWFYPGDNEGVELAYAD